MSEIVVPAVQDQAGERRMERLLRSPRFNGKTFKNTRAVKMMTQGPTLSVIGEFFTGAGKRKPSKPLPLFEHTLRHLQQPVSSRDLRVTWLGHSTVLVEIDGVRLLTDPVWGRRISPVPFAGPVRFHKPPLALSQLGRIDAILLSHDHYDHLDAFTWRELARGAAPGFSGKVITSLGVGAHLEKLGIPAANITELDWSQGAKVGAVDVVSTPSQHFSGRGLLDRNTTLWAGFAIVGPHHKVFFSGDTGPTPEHKDIGQSFGTFDVAMFEIGAFHPSWGDIHLGPDAALQAFKSMGARALLPVHWGTFDLALHAWEQPAERMLEVSNIEQANLLTPMLGEPLLGLDNQRAVNAWWKSAV